MPLDASRRGEHGIPSRAKTGTFGLESGDSTQQVATVSNLEVGVVYHYFFTKTKFNKVPRVFRKILNLKKHRFQSS